MNRLLTCNEAIGMDVSEVFKQLTGLGRAHPSAAWLSLPLARPAIAGGCALALMETLADYGVVPGQHWSMDGEKAFFWSERGLCSALPFSNLTEQHLSVAPGVSAGGAVLKRDGQTRYLVAIQQGGTAFNPHS